jgi:hypothetical protein
MPQAAFHRRRVGGRDDTDFSSELNLNSTEESHRDAISVNNIMGWVESLVETRY